MKASALPFPRDDATHADMPFRDRFALETFDEGGVILDVETGNYFELDRAAARVCHAMYVEETSAGVMRAVCDDLGVGEFGAGRAVNDVLAALNIELERNPPEGPFRYVRQGDGYAYRRGATTVVRVDDDAQTFRLTGTEQVLGVSDCVRAVTPKILALQGTTVLHASAVSIDTHLLAFSGRSGAGKTTTARAFARTSDEMISEDLVVLKPGTDSVGVVRSAEPLIRRWQDETREVLGLDPRAAVSCQPLRDLVVGSTIPLREILFMDERRRGGEAIQREELSRPAALHLLLENIFLGTAEPAGWREHLRRARTIVDFVRTSRLSVPSGIDRLAEAARAYRTISAS